MYGRYPAVERLPCHLLNEQTCRFEEGQEQSAAEAGPPKTALTQWFHLLQCLNRSDPNLLQPIEQNGKVIFTAKYAAEHTTIDSAMAYTSSIKHWFM